jgi:hypothetical protein
VLTPEVRVSFNFLPLHDGQFEAMEKGRLDMVLVADDGYAPTHFAKEVIFRETNLTKLQACLMI